MRTGAPSGSRIPSFRRSCSTSRLLLKAPSQYGLTFLHTETETLVRRTDLLDLERRGLLDRRVIGRRFEFIPAADLREGLGSAAAG